MPTNDFLPFGVAAGANVMTQSAYLALASRSNGFSAGTAASAQLNKAWRQSSVMSYALAQFIANTTNADVLDDGNPTGVLNKLAIAVAMAAQNAGTTWANISGKPTTLAGYGITNGMVAGTGGIGATTSPQATNVNTLPYGGLWSVNPGTVGAPFANGSVLHNAYDVASGNWTQIFADMGGSSMYWRGSLNYSISNLKKLWDSENFNPATKIDASAPVVTGSIAAVATSKLVSGVSPNTTDTPPTAANSVGMHMIFANQQFGADIVVAVNDVAGQLLFRGLGPTAGLGVWRSAWHDGNFTPSSKISGYNCSTAGFAYLGSSQDGDPYMKATNGADVYLASKAYSVLGFQIVKGDTGYIKLPDFLGGFIMQWTKTPVLSTNTTYTWSFPLGFPSKCAGVIGTQIGISQGPLEVSVAPTQASVGLAIGIQTAAVGPAFAWAWGW